MRRHAGRAVLLALAASLGVGGSGLAQSISPDLVVDAAVGDWNRDGRPDLALLAVTDSDSDMMSVLFYMRDDDEDGLLQLALLVPDAVWGNPGTGRIYGQEPSIRALDNGSIALTEQNFAIGRDRWKATRTIALRDGRFVVAGFTFQAWDTLQEEEPLDCDLNLLTGKGLVNGQAVSFPRQAIALEDWYAGPGRDPGVGICRGR